MRWCGGELSAIPGVALGVQAGIKTAGKDDLLLVSLSRGIPKRPRVLHGTLSAPHLSILPRRRSWQPRASPATSHGERHGTGEPGWSAAMAYCDAVATHMGVPAQTVLPFSTGVIGEPLPSNRIVAALAEPG